MAKKKRSKKSKGSRKKPVKGIKKYIKIKPGTSLQNIFR